MPILTPTGGKTTCHILAGKFSYTYDGQTARGCGFKPGVSGLSEWYWASPVNVTAFDIFVKDFRFSYISKIFGRVGGNWVEIWSGTWSFPVDYMWYRKVVSCNNCTGIRIEMHPGGMYAPFIMEVRIDYEAVPPPPPPPPEEGKARIVSIAAPPEFTRNVPFRIDTKLINDGGDDKLFFRLINRDTGKILFDMVNPFISKTGTTWGIDVEVTLIQTTDFHGRVEAGHIEGTSRRVDSSIGKVVRAI